MVPKKMLGFLVVLGVWREKSKGPLEGSWKTDFWENFQTLNVQVKDKTYGSVRIRCGLECT